MSMFEDIRTAICHGERGLPLPPPPVVAANGNFMASSMHKDKFYHGQRAVGGGQHRRGCRAHSYLSLSLSLFYLRVVFSRVIFIT